MSSAIKFRTRQVQKALGIFIIVSILILLHLFKRKTASCYVTNGCQTVHECSCKRKVFHFRPNKSSKFTASKYISTCSDEASQFTPDQKVVSYSLHVPPAGRNRYILQLFKKGILDNLSRIREYYPGYLMRLYTDQNLNSEYCRMICENEDLHWCDIRKTPSHGDLSKMSYMSWRFLPLGDDTVDTFHSRDLDSVIGLREIAAVNDWLDNLPNKSIQVMRDNQLHNFPVMGGLWGAKNKQLGERRAVVMQASIVVLSSSPIRGVRNKKGIDQVVLFKTLFSPANYEDIVAYDSYHCDKWTGFANTTVRPFPTRRLDKVGDFVGNSELARSKHVMEPCPVACRPSYGKNWTYC